MNRVTKKIEEEGLSLFHKIASGIDIQDLSLVCAGGAIGGLLQPVIASFNPNQNNPDLGNWFMGPLLGMAAAGITVFVLANTNTANKLRLIFFSLLCGLAFPSVLTRAVDGLNEVSQQVTNKSNEIIGLSTEGNQVQAAKELTTTMTQAPADDAQLQKEAEKKLEASANSVVSGLAQTAETDDPKGKDAIKKLEQIGTTARDNGYSGVALRVTEELKRIEANKKVTAPQKDEAADAADSVIGVGSTE